MENQFVNTKFLSASKRMHEEQVARKQIKPEMFYGVDYLDRATLGITKSDLIVLGAKTASGKTQFMTNIASFNAARGKKIGYFALEAEKGEIERRMRYQTLANFWYADPANRDNVGRIKERPNYNLWKKGKFDELNRYDDEAMEKLSRTGVLDNLFTFYRASGRFTVKDLIHEMGVNSHLDLFMIDHLQYFDIMGSNENKEVKEIIMSIRDQNLLYEKPIILATHVRKNIEKNKSVVPSIEDIHGSSDIYKISTQTILWGLNATPQKNLTMFHVAKCRDDGSVSIYQGEVEYDASKLCYSEAFKLFYNRDKLEEVPPEKCPPWTKYNNEGLRFIPEYGSP